MITKRLEPSPDIRFLDGATNGSSEHEQSYLADRGDRTWRVNDSPLADYSRRAHIFGRPSGLIDLISERISPSDENVGLDVAAGSSARALRDLLESGVLGLALATNYENLMSTDLSDDSRLDQINGDLTLEWTWHRIRQWKDRHASQGFAIVMHRPIGGLQELSAHTYRGAAHLLLDMVQPEGIMFTQVPRRLVRDQRALSRVCSGVRARSDVAEVITSARKAQQIDNDQNDLYAVILKR